MKIHTYWLKLFTVFIFTFLFSHLYAVQIDLNGTIEKINGDGNLSTCRVGDEFILKNTTSYDGIPFDLKIRVTAEDNQADLLTKTSGAFIKRPCIGVKDGLVEFILRDMADETGIDDPDTVAFMDIEISTVRQDNKLPLTVNSLQFTALDLDTNPGTNKSSSDDIYIASPGYAIKDSNLSLVSIDDNGSFNNGFDIKVQGRTDDNCNDSLTHPEPECRVSGFIEINNPTDKLRIRIQNDNAFGEINSTSTRYNIVYRLTQISFKDIVGLGIDHGDMPVSYGDAYHDIRHTVILGQTPADREVFVPSENADSDDADINTTSFDDEDAVTIVGQESNDTFSVSQGRSYDFNVTTTGSGYLSAWIDYNNNGRFDAGEKVIDDQRMEDANLTTIQTIIPITIAANAIGGKSYVRFRFSQNQGVGPTGDGGTGEVEDYVIMIGGTGPLSGYVYNDKNGNGSPDAGEPNLANVTVNVTDASGATLTTQTDATGNYSFNAVATGEANVTIDTTTLSAGVAQTEGTNPTTVTILGNTNNIEENNGFQLQVDLKTEKTVDNPSPSEGATIVYTLKVTNNGPSDATNVSLTDKLPTGVTYVSHTGDGTYVASTGIWTIPSLAHGTDATLNITATVNSGTSGQSIVNITTAASTPDANDTTPDGDDLNETITVGGKPVVTISDVTVVEGADLIFDVNISEVSNFPTTIEITTEDNTATQGKDYVAVNTTVTIPAGQRGVQVPVKSIDDTVYEPTPETFDLKGNVTSGNTQNTDPSGTGTITDNDTVPSVTITGPNGGDAKVVEGTPLVFDINLSNPTTEDIVIDLSTLNGTAISGEDYNATTGTVTIDAETTGTTFTVVTIDDLIDEVDYEENLTLNGTVSSGTVSNTTVVGTGIILDNDVDAVDDNASGQTGEPVTIDVLSNDGNDLNASSVRLVDPTTNKPVTKLEVPGEGTWDVNTTTGKITFTPNSGFVGNPTPVEYTVKDTAGNESKPAKVTVTYPTPEVKALDDNKQGETGESVTIDVLANDTHDAPLDPSTVKIIDPKTGNPVDELVVSGQGKWIVATNGKITFVPEAGFIGNPTPIKYTVQDIAGNLSNQATVTVTYPSNVPAAGDDNTTTEVGNPATINLLNNDTDKENDLNASTVDLIPPSGIDGNDTDGDGDIDLIVVPNEGTWSVDDAGVVTFIPDNGFTADPTPIQYTIQDGDGSVSNAADINVNVLQQLHDDSIGIDVALNAKVYPTVTMNILKNDDSVVASTISLKGPTDSTSTDTNGDGYNDKIAVPGEGVWTVDKNGTVTFVPDTTFRGNPTPITYTAQDNTGHTLKPATITIVYSTHVENNNTQVVNNPYPVYINTGGGGTAKPITEPLTEGDEPFANDDNATFCEGTSLVFNAAANDTPNPGGTFNILNPETGAIMTTGQTLRLEYGSVTMNKEGVFTYTPFPETLTIDAIMEEHFTYRLTTVTGAHATAKVYICIACCPESSDTVDALSNIGLVTLLFMFASLGLYFIGKEEEANI